MSTRNNDRFSIFVPAEEPESRMPDHLEVVDSGKGGVPRERLNAGAYDPYQKQDTDKPGDTGRVRRPRVDLRKLSEWIKATQRVKAMREEERAAQAQAPGQTKPTSK